MLQFPLQLGTFSYLAVLQYHDQRTKEEVTTEYGLAFLYVIHFHY